MSGFGFGRPTGNGWFTKHKDGDKLVDIVQWGCVRFDNLGGYFFRCKNLGRVSARDAPDLTGVTNMRGMFNGARAFRGDLTAWDVSSVIDMSDMFYHATVFESDLTSWNVSCVTNMSYMFYYAHAFNSDLSQWDVGRVTNFDCMFYAASAFQSDLSRWTVGEIASNTNFMFHAADAFHKSGGPGVHAPWFSNSELILFPP